MGADLAVVHHVADCQCEHFGDAEMRKTKNI